MPGSVLSNRRQSNRRFRQSASSGTVLRCQCSFGSNDGRAWNAGLHQVFLSESNITYVPTLFIKLNIGPPMSPTAGWCAFLLPSTRHVPLTHHRFNLHKHFIHFLHYTLQLAEEWRSN